MIDELKKNIDTEISVLREISSYSRRIESAPEYEKRLLGDAIKSLTETIRIINSSIPDMMKDISLARKLAPSFKKKQKSKMENIEFRRINSKVDVVLNVKDKEIFLKELSISEKLIKQLKKREIAEKEKFEEFKASRGYLKQANKFFFKRANKAIDSGKYKSLSVGLRKANIEILFTSYVAMIYFSVFLSIVASILIIAFLLFFEIGASFPFINFYSGNIFLRLASVFWVIIVLPLLVFSSLYFYPFTERKAIGRKIDQEIPFAVIHMSAISGSGIEPSEIFKIIGLSQEYPYLRREIRKVLNQINLYGYDLTTALTNAAKMAPSDNLAELFSGLATTINSGADLSSFFEKRAGSLLLNYRLERERYTRVVETFLDIYISVVIAAPMIFLLLLIMMSISGIQVGFTSAQLSLMGIFGIAMLNVFFIVFLQIKQPGY